MISSKSPKILITDKNRSFMKATAEYLLSMGYFAVYPEAKTDPEKIIAMLRAIKPDAVVISSTNGKIINTIRESINMGLDTYFIIKTPYINYRLPGDIPHNRYTILTEPIESEKILDTLKERVPFPSAEQAKSIAVRKAVTEMLKKIGIPAHLKGYTYVREAIIMIIEEGDPFGAFRKNLYQELAQMVGSTAQAVERAIRTAIEAGFNRGDLDFIEQLFCNTIRSDKGKPTNFEFISLVADAVSEDMELQCFPEVVTAIRCKKGENK